jgi:hypothetical protein
MMFTKEVLADWLKARAAYHRHRCSIYTGKARRLKKHGFYVPHDELWRYDEYLALADNEMLYAAILYEEAERVLRLRAHELRDDIRKADAREYDDETN